MTDPKPVTITRVDSGSYSGPTPQPLAMIGDPLADPVASDADVSALIDDAGSDTRASLDAIYEAIADVDEDVAALVANATSDTRVALDLVYTPVEVTDEDVEALVENAASATHLALDVLYDFATVATAFTGYNASATQTLKNVTGTLTWVTDGA